MLRKPVPFHDSCVLCSYSQICFLIFSLFAVFSVCLRQSSKNLEAGKAQRVIQSLNVFCFMFEETKFDFSHKSLSVIFISGAENNYRWRKGWNIPMI